MARGLGPHGSRETRCVQWSRDSGASPWVFVGDVSDYGISKVTANCCFPSVAINVDSGDRPQSRARVTRSVKELPALGKRCLHLRSPQSRGWEKASGTLAEGVAGSEPGGGWRPFLAVPCPPAGPRVRRWPSRNLGSISYEVKGLDATCRKCLLHVIFLVRR